MTATLLSLSLLSSCTGQEGNGDRTTDGTSAPTDLTEAVTEQETEPTVEAFSPLGDAELASNFSFNENYSVSPTTREEAIDVALGDVSLQVNMQSAYYGTESAIDRDTYHWGDILRYSDRNITGFQSTFRVGDLNGDRRGEILTYENGILTAYTMPKTGTSTSIIKKY